MNARDEIYRHHMESHLKFVYFILGVTASAIAFAVHQTGDQTISWLHVPIGFAVAMWTLSFAAGIRGLGWRQGVMTANLEMVSLQSGEQNVSPAFRAEAITTLRSILETQNNKIGALFRTQQWLLLAGAVFYIIGHVMQMAGRGP